MVAIKACTDAFFRDNNLHDEMLDFLNKMPDKLFTDAEFCEKAIKVNNNLIKRASEETFRTNHFKLALSMVKHDKFLLRRLPIQLLQDKNFLDEAYKTMVDKKYLTEFLEKRFPEEIQAAKLNRTSKFQYSTQDPNPVIVSFSENRYRASQGTQPERGAPKN